MKPAQVAAIVSEIQKFPSKLGSFELSVLKNAKIKIGRDENTSPNLDKWLMSIYERITDAPRRYGR